MSNNEMIGMETMALEKLKGILVPPINPKGCGDWKKVERDLGTPLPEDYKEYIETYGTGSIDDFIHVLSPFAENKYLNLFVCLKKITDVYEYLETSGSEVLKYPIYPAQGGLIQWGFTDNGDFLFWKPVGNNPLLWNVVVNEGRAPIYEEFKCTMSEFLANVLRFKDYCSIFPSDFPSDDPTFRP